jgi:inosine-uridine nucleoside N-ribohydrolase
VAAGAEVSLTPRQLAQPIIDDERHWPQHLACHTSPPGAALDLLHRSIDSHATVVAIGPFTNLALLEVIRPGQLSRVPVVAVGGWIQPYSPGLPAWGPEMDFNVQWDINAAQIVAAAADLTLVPLPVTLKAHLRAADLPRLRASGPLGRLLAGQAKAHGQDWDMAAMGRAHAALPDDLLNFQYDPVAVAVALGWSGAILRQMSLRPVVIDEVLRFQPDPKGRPTRVLVDLDGVDFAETWLSAVEAAQLS